MLSVFLFHPLIAQWLRAPGCRPMCLVRIFLSGNKMKHDQTCLTASRQNPGYPSSILGGGIHPVGRIFLGDLRGGFTILASLGLPTLTPST